MKNKILIILLLLTALFATTSCINYTELNQIGIINTMGINKTDNKYIININMLIPNENNINESVTLEQKGTTITEAYNNLYLSTSKKVNLSHLDLLILSNDLNEQDYINIKDFFLSQKDSRNNFNVVILENYSSSNIFKFNTIDINNLILTNSKELGIVTPKTIDEVIQDILTLNSSYIPTIKIDNDIEILGYRSIYNNEKLLTKEESKTFNFITNNIKESNISYKNTNIKVESNNTSISINKNVITINIFSTISGDIKSIKNIYELILKNNINNYIKNNDLTYFYNLVEKYNKTPNNKNLDFSININTKLNRVINNE